MKPKRRTAARSSSSVRTSRVKRIRLDSGSPVRRKSSGEVRPPPEFLPFDYAKECSKFKELLDKDYDGFDINSNDLMRLQYDLEAMLAHAGEYSRRANNELTFINTGEYPMENLSERPTPVYSLRELTKPPTTSDDEQEEICGLPVDETEDDIDIWPPHHMATRFWNWCKHDFSAPVDVQFLKDFKRLVMDPNSSEVLSEYYVNEPWKYRKKMKKSNKCHETTPNSVKRRRLSCEDRTDDSLYKIHNKEKLPSLIGNVVNFVSREIKKEADSMSPEYSNGRRYSGRLHKDDLSDCDKKSSGHPKEEISDLYVDIDCSKSSPPSSRLSSPRVKKDEEDQLFFDTPTSSSSYCNGKSEIKKKNGETKKINGTANLPESVLNHRPSLPMEMFQYDISIDDLSRYVDIGEKLIKVLAQKNLVPDFVPYLYGHTTKEEEKIEISLEGKEPSEEIELDEVSEELLKCQQELKELEPALKLITGHCFRNLKKDFAYWETAGQLDDADHDLFRLGVNMYREFPRRTPTIAEWPPLKEAVKRRNKKARLHYSRLYKRQPAFCEEGTGE